MAQPVLPPQQQEQQATEEPSKEDHPAPQRVRGGSFALALALVLAAVARFAKALASSSSRLCWAGSWLGLPPWLAACLLLGRHLGLRQLLLAHQIVNSPAKAKSGKAATEAVGSAKQRAAKGKKQCQAPGLYLAVPVASACGAWPFPGIELFLSCTYFPFRVLAQANLKELKHPI